MCLLDWWDNKEELWLPWLPWALEYVAEERKKEILTENISKALTGRNDKAIARLECRRGRQCVYDLE